MLNLEVAAPPPVTRHVRTPLLEIAYESRGSASAHPVLLLHGWPDDVRTFDAVAVELESAGCHTIAPWLRGCGGTRFLESATPRSGQVVAMVQDALDLADALGLDRFSVVGHDWGARIAYGLAALVPERVDRVVALSLGWDPGEVRTPPCEEAQRYWYQWFMATERGCVVVRDQGEAFARFLWDTWSPQGWVDDRAFHVTSRAFQNPDWAAVAVHASRVRWDEAAPDPRYADLEHRSRSARTIAAPTLVIHGGDDRVVPSAQSYDAERHFTGSYRRVVLPGVGHFPTREAPKAVAQLVRTFLRECRSSVPSR